MLLNNFPVVAADYRQLAEKTLPKFLFDYVDGGANDEVTLTSNLAGFREYCLKQRVMQDVSGVDTSCVLAGVPATMPLALAPVGMAGMMARRGEVQAAKAAESVGVPFTASTVGVCSVEEIVAATNHPCWFQLYMLRDRDVVLRILERAKTAGCDTLVFTVDLAVAGMRHRDTRNGMVNGALKGQLMTVRDVLKRPRWLFDVAVNGRPHSIGNLEGMVSGSDDLESLRVFIESQFDASVTWKDIAWLRSVWDGKLIIKGVLEADDARSAVDTGADGIVVSNHGGRQLDGVVSSISKLPAIAAAVGDQVEVYMDGGIRSGVDVVKAVALGANGVLIGRPWVWALAAGKEKGLQAMLHTFQQEIEVAMALMGVKCIGELHSGLVEK